MSSAQFESRAAVVELELFVRSKLRRVAPITALLAKEVTVVRTLVAVAAVAGIAPPQIELGPRVALAARHIIVAAFQRELRIAFLVVVEVELPLGRIPH